MERITENIAIILPIQQKASLAYSLKWHTQPKIFKIEPKVFFLLLKTGVSHVTGFVSRWS